MTNRNVAWKGVRWIHTTWVWTLAWVSPSWGANVEEGLVFFEQKIRPLLATQCYECHAGQSGKKKGGLQLDSVQGLLRGGDSGPVLIAGDPQASLLWAVAHHEEGLAMPPDQPALEPLIEPPCYLDPNGPTDARRLTQYREDLGRNASLGLPAHPKPLPSRRPSIRLESQGHGPFHSQRP